MKVFSNVLLLVSISACGALHTARGVCVPGESQECVCTNGNLGTQLCASDGLSWEVCVCDVVEGDADVDGDNDADEDVGVDGDIESDTYIVDDADPDDDWDGVCIAGCDGGACDRGEWATICAGSFTMGSPNDETGRFERETQHEVTLTHDFLILSTEVTVSDFFELMGYSPAVFSECGNCPCEMLSWHTSAVYCNALSEREDRPLCYECTVNMGRTSCTPSDAFTTPYDCPGYRLPTEAEWEYAARAGDQRGTYNGEPDVERCESSETMEPIAWFCGNSRETSHTIGSLEPNAWGLYDTLGNVYEWCGDWHDDYPTGPVTNPFGPATGSTRVNRGGSWIHEARYSRAAFRGRDSPGLIGLDLGLRPAITLHR